MAADSDSVARENFQYYTYCRENGHREFLERAKTCNEFVQNKQWKEADIQKLRAIGRPVLTINKMIPTIAAIMGAHLSNRADVTFRPVRDATQEVADVLAKLYLNIGNLNKLDDLESNNCERAIITGRAYYDVRIEFDSQMMGEVKITTPRPQNVVLDPEIEEADPQTWPQVFVTRFLALNDIELMFGKGVAEKVKYMGDLSSTLDPDSIIERPQLLNTETADPALRRMFRVVERQHRQLRLQEHFVDPDTGDMSPIPDSWKPDHISEVLQQFQLNTVMKKVESVRWTVSMDRYLLHDDWSPYKRFTIVPYFPYFIDNTPMGIIELLLSPQELLNKASSQELHILNTSSNSGWKVKTGALANMTVEELEERGAETGLVVELTAGMDELEKILPNNVPTGHDRLTYKAAENIKEISGVSDSMMGQDRADVASKAIMAKQARAKEQMARMFDNLNKSRRMVAEHILELVQGFYTEERLFSVTGGNIAAPRSEEVTINQESPEGTVVNDLTVGKYSVVVTPAPDIDSYEESQLEQLRSLKELGVPIPADEFVASSSLSNKRELAQRIRELAGNKDPSENDVRQQQLEQMQQEMEMRMQQAETMLKEANAMLAQARAQKASTEAQIKPVEVALEGKKQQNEERAIQLDAATKMAKIKADADSKSEDRDHSAALEITKMKHEKENKPKPKKSTEKKK